NLQPMYKTVSSILERIRGWDGDPPAQPPPVVLNKHCPYCPFKSVCSRQAEEADDLSLLDHMTSKGIRRYNSKGIFTDKQLSFLFRPRRRRRRRAAQPPHFDLEIQALAIRTVKETGTAKRKGPGAPKGHQAYERTVPAGRRTVIQVA